MISFEEAQLLVFEHCLPLQTVTLPLSQALGHALAEDVVSPIDMPPFDQSAMDGYATRRGPGSTYSVIDEIQAGKDASNTVLQPGEAVRIFTGAMVPESADTVVRQEITSREGTILTLLEPYQDGLNIRYTGEQIRKGNVAVNAGFVLNAAAIGFLAMVGITEVVVYRKPEIRILITGDELVAPGQPLPKGKIYESNAITLLTALQSNGFAAELLRIADDYPTTFETVKALLKSADVVISTGGISVGDYDFMGKALRENGVTEHFYKVKQKPGKPLFFGTTDRCKVFALPGNPAAALTSTYLYVLPALKKMLGHSHFLPETRQLALNNSYTKGAGLTHLLKGRIDGNSVTLLDHQSSAMLDSFARANAIVRLDEDQEEWNVGDLVTTYSFL